MEIKTSSIKWSILSTACLTCLKGIPQLFGTFHIYCFPLQSLSYLRIEMLKLKLASNWLEIFKKFTSHFLKKLIWNDPNKASILRWVQTSDIKMLLG